MPETLPQFINDNWQTLCGIVSVVFMAGYYFYGIRQIKSDRALDNQVRSEQREQDYKDFELQMREQKKDHDEKIAALAIGVSTVTAKVDSVKDETFKAITMIQLDIREIMTLLKGQQMK